jgi:hypothetical protein
VIWRVVAVGLGEDVILRDSVGLGEVIILGDSVESGILVRGDSVKGILVRRIGSGMGVNHTITRFGYSSWVHH